VCWKMLKSGLCGEAMLIGFVSFCGVSVTIMAALSEGQRKRPPSALRAGAGRLQGSRVLTSTLPKKQHRTQRRLLWRSALRGLCCQSQKNTFALPPSAGFSFSGGLVTSASEGGNRPIPGSRTARGPGQRTGTLPRLQRKPVQSRKHGHCGRQG
jgi:hypothetical protein